MTASATTQTDHEIRPRQVVGGETYSSEVLEPPCSGEVFASRSTQARVYET
jgi:hypothetical protein